MPSPTTPQSTLDDWRSAFQRAGYKSVIERGTSSSEAAYTYCNIILQHLERNPWEVFPPSRNPKSFSRQFLIELSELSKSLQDKTSEEKSSVIEDVIDAADVRFINQGSRRSRNFILAQDILAVRNGHKKHRLGQEFTFVNQNESLGSNGKRLAPTAFNYKLSKKSRKLDFTNTIQSTHSESVTLFAAPQLPFYNHFIPSTGGSVPLDTFASVSLAIDTPDAEDGDVKPPFQVRAQASAQGNQVQAKMSQTERAIRDYTCNRGTQNSNTEIQGGQSCVSSNEANANEQPPLSIDDESQEDDGEGSVRIPSQEACAQRTLMVLLQQKEILYRSLSTHHPSSSEDTWLEQSPPQHQVGSECCQPSNSLLGAHSSDLDLDGLKPKELQVLKALKSEIQKERRFISDSQSFLQRAEEARKALADEQQCGEEQKALEQEYARKFQALHDTKAKIEEEVTKRFPRYTRDAVTEPLANDTPDPFAEADIAALHIYRSCVGEQIKPLEDSVKELHDRITSITTARENAAREVTDIEKLVDEVSAKKDAAKARAQRIEETKWALSRYIEGMWGTDNKS